MVLPVIPDTADIIIACLAGNLDRVRQLLGSRQASIYDITAGNVNLLLVWRIR